MFVLGGFIDGSATESVLKFDSTQETWSQIAPMQEPRFALAACAIGNDIYAFGGSGTDFNTHASVFKLDTVANEWSTLAPMPVVSVYHSVSVLDGLMYIAGAGDNGRAVLRFDPASGAWSTLAPTSTSRMVGATFVVDGCLYLAEAQNMVQAWSATIGPRTRGFL
jgi:hypothetical protein